MQFGVGQLGLIGNQRDRVGSRITRGFEHRDHGGGGRCDKFAMRLRQNGIPLARAEHVQTGEPTFGLRNRVVQQPNVVGQHLLDEFGT